MFYLAQEYFSYFYPLAHYAGEDCPCGIEQLNKRRIYFYEALIHLDVELVEKAHSSHRLRTSFIKVSKAMSKYIRTHKIRSEYLAGGLM